MSMLFWLFAFSSSFFFSTFIMQFAAQSLGVNVG